MSWIMHYFSVGYHGTVGELNRNSYFSVLGHPSYPQYRYSDQSKTCNEVANHADFLNVDRAFEALQNGIKISTKNSWPGILRPEDTGIKRGFGRYLVYFDFKN